MAETPDSKIYMTPDEAATYVRRSPRTLEEYRINKTGPAYLKLGSSKRSNVLYRKQDLDTWLESFLVKPEQG